MMRFGEAFGDEYSERLEQEAFNNKWNAPVAPEQTWPADALVAVDGEPGADPRRAATLSIGATLVVKQVEAAGDRPGWCPAVVRHEAGGSVSVQLLESGFEEGGESTYRAAVWIGDEPFRAGLCLYDVAEVGRPGRSTILPLVGAVIEDKAQITELNRDMTIVQPFVDSAD